MGFFDFLKPNNKLKIITEPTKGKEKEVHFSKVEKFIDGEIVAFAYFPEFQSDYFGVEIIKNEFSNRIIKQPYYIHSSKADKVMLFAKKISVFKIGLRTIDDINFLTLEAYQKEIKFLQSDKFFILFENGVKWDFEISKKGVRVAKDSDGVLYETILELTEEQMKYLCDFSITKWYYTKASIEIEYSNQLNLEKQNQIKEMALMMNMIKYVEIDGL